jgi:predicted GH43/DUF377 family glycosyl hydrolase
MTATTLPSFPATVERLGVVLAPDGSAEEAEGVLNPAGVRDRDGRYVLYPRCVAAGNRSRVGRVRVVENGADRSYVRDGFALEPSSGYERRIVPGGEGCEDPRVTFVPVLDRFVMVYTAFGPLGPRIALALSHDATTWERFGLMDFSGAGLPSGDDKDGMFFPEPVLSPSGMRSLAMYHRPMLHLSTLDGRGAVPQILDMDPRDRESTCIAYIPLEPVLADLKNLRTVAESAVVLSPDGDWGKIKTGGGTPPVRIAEGWFSVFHAVDAVERDGRTQMRYSAGLVVHDATQPHRVLYRSPEPIMVPEGADELHGIVNNVVFPTAIDACTVPRTFDVYYGMADAKIGRARISLAEALAAE